MTTHEHTREKLSIDEILAMRPVLLPETPLWLADGKTVVFASAASGEPQLWTISSEGGLATRLTVSMGGVRFLASYLSKRSPDGRWIAYTSGASGSAELWLQPVAGGEAQQLTHMGAHINAFSWAPDSQSIVFSGNRYGRYDIYVAEVPTGQTVRRTFDTLYEVYPVFTADGTSILYVRLNEAWSDHQIVKLPVSGGAGQVIAEDEDFFDYHYGKTFGHPLPSPDGNKVLFRSHRSGFINYWSVSASGGKATQFAPQEADQNEAAWSPDGKTLAFIRNHKGTLALCLAPAGGGDVRVLVDPDVGACSMPQWSPDGTKISYLLQGPAQPLDLYVVAVDSGKTKRLTDSRLAGDPANRLTAPQKVEYEGFGGLPIHAYLYKPSDIQPGDRRPCILWIHGGPTGQWFDAFYLNVQYFVQQGYVVLLPNIRGSSGYGKEFEDLNNRDWGHDDLQDAIAGVEYLKTLDVVDPGKMAITGTSYGGCLSMSAVCFAPGVFQAAIPASGYADWRAMYEEQELRHIKLLEYEFGPYKTSEAVYRKCSPIFSAAQATTPTFVVHGEGRLPKSSASRDFVHAMVKEYKIVEYKVYPGECYYVMSKANTRQMWLDMQDFLARYL